MSKECIKKLQFRPKARIIRTIGDQLISGPEAAVIELVKNAYDADASTVTIKFSPPLTEGSGRITVIDDGHGMSLQDIQQKWMEPATSVKALNRRSPVKRRYVMGSKGIGRFAAAKLGRKMGLSSINENEGDLQEVLIPDIDWAVFNDDVYLSDISIDYYSQKAEQNTGTTLEISELNETWSESKLNRLHLELRRLISPLQKSDNTDSFEIFLDLSECTKNVCGFDGTTIVNAGLAIEETSKKGQDRKTFQVLPFPLLTTCDYELSGKFDDQGVFRGTFQIKRGNRPPDSVEISIPLGEDEQSCGDVEVKLFLFDREAAAIKKNMKTAGLGDLTAGKARQKIDNISGVAIYRDGFRIRPYGDPENDWLTLDSRRVQDPSLRIGHNQIAGFISVEDQLESNLVERSSREGFEENTAFNRLRKLVRELLTKIIEPRRHKFRSDAGLSRAKSTTFSEVRKLSEFKKIKKIVQSLKPDEQKIAEKVIEKQSALLSDKIDQLEDRQRILEAKSSLGAIIGEVLHEGAPSATYVAKTAHRLKLLYPSLVTPQGKSTKIAQEEFPGKLDLLLENGKRIQNLFANLRPLAGGKRGTPFLFEPAVIILRAADLFETHQIPIKIQNRNPSLKLEALGYQDDLSTAMINLIGNSVHWLEEAQTKEPFIHISLSLQGKDIVIVVEDNGPGVPEEFVEEIFDVGFTLKDGGTGLGLNIAREALARSDASLSYHLDYDGGARFEIRFPAKKDNK